MNFDKNGNSTILSKFYWRFEKFRNSTRNSTLSKFNWRNSYCRNSVFPRVQLPQDFTCQHCVFQWKYTTGNNWGTDPVTGQSGIGMGIENETFMGCSDISIIGNNSSVNTIPPIIISTTTTSSSTAAATAATSPRGLTTWSSNGVQYKKGDMVYYDDSKFVCVYNHVSYPGAQPGLLTWALWQHMD